MNTPFQHYNTLLERAVAQARSNVFGESDIAARHGLAQYAEDPVGFSVKVLGHKQWEAQKYVQRALIQHRYVALTSCRSASKTWTASELVLAMTCTAPTICITTAPTFEQVKRLMWGPIADSHASSLTKLPGKLNLTELRIGPRWYAVGLSTNDPDNMQGFHSGRTLTIDCEDPSAAAEAQKKIEDAVLDTTERALFAAKKKPEHRLFFVLDECPGIERRLLETLAGSFASQGVYVLAQGNPTFVPDSDHPFARWTRAGSRFHRIHIAYSDFPAEWEPEPADKCFHHVPDEINLGACAALVKEHGIESAFARCHAFGLPASVELERQFVPLRLLVAQDANEPPPDQRAEAVHMGWDVAASEQGDFNALSVWVNGLKIAEEVWRYADTTESVTRVIGCMTKYGLGGKPVPASNVHVDATGIGKGCADMLRQRGYWIDAVDLGGSPKGEWARLTGQMAFADRKTELAWVLRRAMQEGIARLPKRFTESWRQAQWHTWEEKPRAAGSVITVAETKADLKERYGRSPDEWDADCLAWSRGAARPTFRTARNAQELRKLLG